MRDRRAASDHVTLPGDRYPNVVKAALEDEDLYAALAAIDLVRGEGAREHAVGQDVLARMIGRERPE